MFYKKEKSGFEYFFSDIFDDENFVHAFSTRVSKNTNNFALIDKSNLQDSKVLKNRKLFCSAFDIDENSLLMPEQTHSSNIKIVSSHNNHDLSNTDAIIVSEEDIAGMLFFADCTPLILYSKKHRVFAMIHAGWRGSAASISSKTVEIMKKEMNINPCDIKAAIGVCISKCCFETNEDIAQKLKNSLEMPACDIIFEKDKKIYADLKRINALQLIEQGIKDIDIMEYCSVCQNDLFFSYRKEHATTKRHAILAKMKKKRG